MTQFFPSADKELKKVFRLVSCLPEWNYSPFVSNAPFDGMLLHYFFSSVFFEQSLQFALNPPSLDLVSSLKIERTSHYCEELHYFVDGNFFFGWNEAISPGGRVCLYSHAERIRGLMN